MASLPDCAPDSSSLDQRCNDSAWSFRTIPLAKKSGNSAYLGSLSWGAGANTPLRRKFLLYGVSIHAGQEFHAAMDPSATYMAAQAS